MTMTERVAVCGADGFIGRHFVRILERDFRVVAISHDDMKLSPKEIGQKLSGCLAVYNLAGTSLFARWNESVSYSIYSSRILILKKLAKSIEFAECKPEMFFQASFAMQYDSFEVHDEFSTVFEDNLLTETARQIEDISQAFCAKFGIRLIIGRFGLVLGLDGGIFGLLHKMTEAGWGGVVGDGYQCIPIVHVDDAVNSMYFFMQNKSCSGIYNITIPNLCSLSEICDFMAEMRAHQLSVPEPLLKLFCGDGVAVFLTNRKVVPQRLLSGGFVFEFPTAKSVIANLLKG